MQNDLLIKKVLQECYSHFKSHAFDEHARQQ